MLYTICPFCGYKILKGERGAKIEVHCPKCKEKVSIFIKDNMIIIGKFEIKELEEALE